jgi:hypothetical protein
LTRVEEVSTCNSRSSGSNLASLTHDIVQQEKSTGWLLRRSIEARLFTTLEQASPGVLSMLTCDLGLQYPGFIAGVWRRRQSTHSSAMTSPHTISALVGSGLGLVLNSREAGAPDCLKARGEVITLRTNRGGNNMTKPS